MIGACGYYYMWEDEGCGNNCLDLAAMDNKGPGGQIVVDDFILRTLQLVSVILAEQALLKRSPWPSSCTNMLCEHACRCGVSRHLWDLLRGVLPP